MTAGTLDVLLIEDNPGQARLVEEMLTETRGLLHRIEFDGQTPERVSLHHELDLASGMEYVVATDVDVILLDLGLPDSAGLETLATVLEATTFTPVVVLTGLDDRERGIQAIQAGAADYLVKDEVSGELLVHSFQYAIEQMRQERERVRHREQLESLDHLNTITQEITHDVITTSTREDLERAVCERLVAFDDYCFAWIGEPNGRNGQLVPRVSAGTETLSDDLTIGVDADAEDRPERRAARTRETQVRQDSQPGETPPSPTHIDDCEYRAVAAIPISYRRISYGILVIYATEPTAFSEHETEILSRLGDVIGHAITAIERKHALVSDTALQFRFRLAGVGEQLVSLSTNGDCRIDFENFIRSEADILVYGEATGFSRAEFTEVAGASPLIDDLRILSSGEDSYEFECLTSGVAPLARAVATHGGHIASASIEDGEFRIVVEFPQGRDKRQLVELVENTCEGASLFAHRTVRREEPAIPDSWTVFKDRLTVKQRAALEAAYHAGYFEWPRLTNGGDLADRLGVTQATFSQHFRAAEREFFTALFEDDRDVDAPRSSPWESADSRPNTTESG